MTRPFVILALLCLALLPAATRAQTARATATYQAGWNMVGGPTGTEFSAAATLDAWQNGAYVQVPGRIATACAGYWALYYNTAAVPLPLSTGPAQTCSLQPGWNLVGNPFSGMATLPSGTTAYAWRPLAGSYATVSAIDPGGSVWIFSPQAGSVVLTAVPVPTGTVPTPTVVPPTLTINAAGGPGPYQMHVGDTVKLYVNGSTPPTVMADPAHFVLDSSGYQYDLTCTNAVCESNPQALFWIWRAVAPGSGTISVTPTCVGREVACIGDPTLIHFTILP